MKVTCIHCGDSFSITATRLGMRGRCPHCKSPVQLPSSRDQALSAQGCDLPRPRHVQHALLAAGVVLVHVAGLVLLSQLSWSPRSATAIQIEYQFQLPPPPRASIAPSELQTQAPFSVEGLLDRALINPPVDAGLAYAGELPVSDRLLDSSLRLGNGDIFNRTLSGSLGSPAGLTDPMEGGLWRWEQFRRFNNPLHLSEPFDRLLARLTKTGLDLAIVLDSTASMDREIAEVKDGIQRIGQTLFRLVPKARISVCVFRDQGDQYVAKGLPFTDNVATVITFIDDVQAQGGGDQSESVTAGLRWVLANNRFRRDAKKVILVFGDAPPKSDQWLLCRQLVADFRFKQQGVVSTVTCHRRKKLEAFITIAKLGGGESFLNNDQTEIMQQLLVLVFGSRYRNELLRIHADIEKEQRLPAVSRPLILPR